MSGRILSNRESTCSPNRGEIAWLLDDTQRQAPDADGPPGAQRTEARAALTGARLRDLAHPARKMTTWARQCVSAGEGGQRHARLSPRRQPACRAAASCGSLDARRAKARDDRAKN